MTYARPATVLLSLKSPLAPLLMLALLATLAPHCALAQSIDVATVRVRAVDRLHRPHMQADEVERELAQNTWAPPTESDSQWTFVSADSTGWIEHDDLSGYALATLEVDRDGVYVLRGLGYTGVYVNGEPRMGNVYGYKETWESWEPQFDFSRIPVKLHAGTNHLLFFGTRFGRLKAELTRVTEDCGLNAKDVTLPDLVVRQRVNTWGSIVVLNLRDAPLRDARLKVQLEPSDAAWVDIPTVPPLGTRKVRFPIQGSVPREAGSQNLSISLHSQMKIVDAADIPLAVKASHENRRVTFESRIDGSIQYYGFLPASGDDSPKAMFLSLHGAAVEAINQSGSYGGFSWGHVVAPTNRRPYGFNWEGWGRLDALEALDHGTQNLDIDADRVYLTGHSMGGHGTWHLGTLYPDMLPP